MDKFIEDVQKILNEANSDFNVGDIIYLRGSYGIGKNKYEIIKITDSHDEEIKKCKWATDYEPDKDPYPVAIIKNLESGELQTEKINADDYYDPDFISAEQVDSIDLATLDLQELATKLVAKLADVGINADLTFTLSEPEKGKRYGRLTLSSNNIVDQAGVCQLMLKELYVNSWGHSSVWPQENKMGVSLNFNYKHVDGGQNGHEFGRAIYDFGTQDWTVELYKDRR